ncbi:MAG: hypothetical protein ACXWT5_13340 [Methylophilus sp.]
MKTIILLSALALTACADGMGGLRMPIYDPSPASMHLMGIGSQMMSDSQPRPIYAPRQTMCYNQGIYTYCQ